MPAAAQYRCTRLTQIACAELRRCEQLGLKLYNFHPGAWKGWKEKTHALEQVASGAACARRCPASALTCCDSRWQMPSTRHIERPAASRYCWKTCLGRVLRWVPRLKELAEMISHVKDKSRVGVTLDTCHLFAAGVESAGQLYL